MTPRPHAEHRPIDEPECRAALEYFQANRKRIAKTYPDQFVAILYDKVVDTDADYGELTSRVQREFPGRHPYLAYAHPWSLADWVEHFQIEHLDIDADRQAWEDKAAEDVIRRTNA